MRRALMLLSGIVALAAVSAASPEALAAGPERSFRVMMILWRGCEEACRGFRDYLRTRGIPVKYKLQAVRGGPAAVSALVDKAVLAKTDLVVTWGPEITVALVGEHDRVNPNGHLTDIPVLFMMVPDPVAARIVPDLESSGRNVSGTLLAAPEDAQAEVWQAYRPFETLGVISDRRDRNAAPGLQELQRAAAKHGFRLALREIGSNAEGGPGPAKLRRLVAELASEGADYLYLGRQSFLQSNRDAITNAALELGLPVVSAVPTAVSTSNALMSVVSPPYDIGWLTGMRAEEILVEGRDPSEIPIRGLSRFSLMVNMNVAARLDLHPGPEVLRKADIIKVEE